MSNCLASVIVNLALSEVGYLEKKTNSQLSSKTSNSGSANWNKYADYIDKNFPTFYNGKKNGYDWCDIFVDYLFLKSFGLSDALRLTCQPLKSCGAGCTWSLGYFRKNNRFGESPAIGAQIFFGTSVNNSVHTGIVVDFDDNYVDTVEGNSSNSVARRRYNRLDKTIVGYGYPAYDNEKPTPKPPTNENVNQNKTEQTNEGVDILARECIRGLWGNGARRAELLYNAIQTRVNEYLKDNKSKAHSNKGVELMAMDVIRGKYGSGKARSENIYNAVQKRVNELCRG